MSNRRFSLFCLLLILSGLPCLCQPGKPIRQIYFEGLNKTNPTYLMQFIELRAGSPYDSLQVERDAQQLRNLGLFSRVNVHTVPLDDGINLTFSCNELVSLLPIVNLGGISDNFWYQLGVVDMNWLGRGNTLGGYYRYYDRHSFALFAKLPTLFGPRWGISADMSHIATIEPAFFSEGTTEYNVDHQAVIGALRLNRSLRGYFEIAAGFLRESYRKNISRSGAASPGPDKEDFRKFLYKFIASGNAIDYYAHYLSGYSRELNLELVRTQGEEDTFWKILHISSFFFRPGSSGNAAIRLRAGLATNRESPFVPFVLDSYITVRGSGNRISRGTAELTLNSEYRHTLRERGWGAIQGVVFVDMSAWRPAGGDLDQMFFRQNNVTFSGAGLRVQLRRLNNLLLRFDYGHSLTRSKEHGLVLGFGQYF